MSRTDVDRTKICPTLLQTFVILNNLHTPADFNESKLGEPTCVYIWRDSTLREVIDLVRSAAKLTLNDDARIVIQIVFPNKVSSYIHACQIDEIHLIWVKRPESSL